MPSDEAVERLRAASGLQEAVAAFRLLAPRAQSPPEPGVVAPRVFDLGIDAKAAERTDVAEECFRFALAVARGSGSAGLEAGANNYLGILALEDGRLAAAAARFEAAQRLREAARPRPTDDAWVYLAGTIVNLGNAKLAGWDAAGAAECYAAATARFREAESAGSRTRSLAPFRANAERGAAAAAKLGTLARPGVRFATMAAPARTDLLTTPSVLAYVGRANDALADAGDLDTTDALRLRAMAKGGFLRGPDAGFEKWDWGRHDEAAQGFDEAIFRAPDDLELRVFKARALGSAAAAGQASVRALEGARDTYSEDVLEQLLDVPRRRYVGGTRRALDAYDQALRVAPSEALQEERALSLADLR